MPEPSDSYVLVDDFKQRGLKDIVRDLLEDVIDVAQRLNHNLLAPEHLMVVAAENGVEEMARLMPGLSAFREALLDALYDDRDMLRYQPAANDERLWMQAGLHQALQQIQNGDSVPDVLVEVMLSELPRITQAVAYARGTGPDILPPDTITLDQALSSDESGVFSLQPEAAPEAGHATPPTDSEPETIDVPLTMNLGTEAIEDPPMVGRAALADQVSRILLRFHQPAALLIGAPGAGKTAFVRGLAGAAARGEMPALAGFTFYQLKLLDLVSQSHRGQDLHNLLDQILEVIQSDKTGVLVIDDLHLLVAKQGYPLMSDLIDTIKLHISKGNLRALLTVEEGAFNKSFHGDSFFTSQITVKTLAALDRPELVEAATVYRPRLERHFSVRITDSALEAAVTASLSEDGSDYNPPGSIIRLLDEACAMARAESSEEVLDTHVHKCFSEETEARSHHDRRQLREIESSLSSRVLGQDLAAAVVGRRVRLAKLHLDRKPERPDGVFLFMGPSGVGKTEMARALARALYADESRLVRLDMSEYMEPHSVARIIGAPPGYVGYGEDGALTGPVAKLGHCVVLLDEIEKAHPRVLNLFLQVFDDGRLTDSKGRFIDFSETVIIMTSNIGRELYAIHGTPAIGFGGGDDDEPADDVPVRDAVQDHLLRVLPSEFVNRIDEIVPFRVLDDNDVRLIAENLLVLEVERWKERGKAVTYSPEVPGLVASSGYDPRLGARHVERNLERLVISLMSDAAVADDFDDVKAMHLSVADGGVCLTVDGKPFLCLDAQRGTPQEGSSDN
ncbi:MAG: ATP-dependent Clp protease ATP-binding subunit ClpA [Pseudohongiellaceae bacterium]|jgi:ATP-dependent Clp protease ATP-binding subunit ClpA